jgi:hypothetical protein
MGREYLRTSGRKISDQFGVIVVGEGEGNCCVTQGKTLVIIIW